MTLRAVEWVGFAILVVGVVLYQSDVHWAVRGLGAVCLVVGPLAEMSAVVRGYLRRRAG